MDSTLPTNNISDEMIEQMLMTHHLVYPKPSIEGNNSGTHVTVKVLKWLKLVMVK